MPLSPKKYVSNYTSCMVQRGVEAKDVELTHAHLDVTTSNSSQCRAESSVDREQPSIHRADTTPDDAASYLQVVVEKHRRRREMAAAQTSPRLPSASSPLAHAPPLPHQQRNGHGGGDRGVYVLPHPVLLACPTGSPLCHALQAHNYYTRSALVDAATCARSAASLAPHDAPAALGAGDAPDPPPHAQKKNKTWHIFRDISSDQLQENEPERVEVYYFEQGEGAWLATCDGGRESWCERSARRPARAARALLAEALAVPALLLAAPLAVLLATQRAVLVLVRGAVTGAVQTASDYVLKPALTLTFNALLQPLLVFGANVSRGVRAALRPLAAALGDAVEPAARLLGAVRLVDVRLACPDCAHRALV